jgi:hypothetical protein
VPKVFISYSWTSEQYSQRVLLFVQGLRRDGIEVVFDQFDLAVGADRFRFMQTSVNDPDVTKVIALCDRRYKERSDQRQGGVGIENTIITPEVYNQAMVAPDSEKSRKFIAVLFEPHISPEEIVPTIFSTLLHIDLSKPERRDSEYETLLRFLTDTPRLTREPLGVLPSFLTNVPTRSGAAHTALSRMRQKIDENNEAGATGAFKDALDRLVVELEAIPPLTHHPDTLDEKAWVDQLDTFSSWSNDFVGAVIYWLRFMPPQRLVGVLASGLERLIQFRFEYGSKYQEQAAHLRFILRDAFVQITTAFLDSDNLEELATLLAYPFVLRSRSGVAKSSYTRLDQDTVSPQNFNVDKWVIHHMQSELSNKNLYKDAEFLLWLRAKINENKLDQYDNWYLRELSRYPELEYVVMARCASTTYGNRLANVLGYADLEKLRNRIQVVFGEELHKPLRPYTYTTVSKMLIFELWGSQR